MTPTATAKSEHGLHAGATTDLIPPQRHKKSKAICSVDQLRA
jgi:hypothetical protein